jgi:hypothetical protein
MKLDYFAINVNRNVPDISLLCHSSTANKSSRRPSEKIQNMIPRARYFSRSTSAFSFEKIPGIYYLLWKLSNNHDIIKIKHILSQTIL